MASIKKAGVEFEIFVDTAKDILGKPSGFSGKIISNADGSEVATSSFTEVIETITAASTTLSAAASKDDRTISVDDISGFELGNTILLNGVFYVIMAIDTGANTFSLDHGLEGAAASGDTVDKRGNTGTYKASVTINNVGDYVVFVSNYELNMGHTSYPLTIEAATTDDVKQLLDSVASEVSSIKTQVDVLDEDSLNSLAGKIETVDSTVTNIKELLDDAQDVVLTLNGDETGILVVDATVTGDTSGATGVVTSSSYDSDADTTTIAVNNVDGTFVTGETLNDGTNSTTGTIQSIVNDIVNNVIDFVKKINEALTEGGSSLEALKTINADIEAMLKGDDKLADGTTDNPTAGKGLIQIFDDLAVAKDDVSEIRTLAEDAAYGFSAIRTAVDNARISIESKIDALTDTDDENSLISKINAVKTVVDANKTTLEDSGFGLSAIKNALDNVAGLFADGGAIEVRIDDIDTALDQLATAINDQTTHIDGRFDEVLGSIASLKNESKFSIFA